MRPKTQKKIRFINDCGCLVNEALLERAMLWYAYDNLKSPRKIFMHGKYPAVAIYRKKLHVHRLIGMYLYRDYIACQIVVHHIDGDRFNCLASNLELMSSKMHGSHHNKGKKLSDEHKRKISEANKKRKGIKMRRKYKIPLDELRVFMREGKSISAIARHYGCGWDVIKQRIYESPELLDA